MKIHKKNDRFAVFGAGHGGKAMAAHLSIMGAEVTLYNRTWKHVEVIAQRGGIALSGDAGAPNGFGELALVTSDVEEALYGNDVIFVVVPAFAHAELARRMAPHLVDGQIMILNPGRTLGAFEFRKVLYDSGCTARVAVAETQTFIFASRSTGPAQAYIHRVKEAVPLAALPAFDTPVVLAAIKDYYPEFIDGKTVLHTGLNNIGAVFHPTIMINNIGRIESTDGEFEFYYDGVTPTVAKLMEAVDRERINVGKALGIDLLTAQEWLKLAYDAEGDDLHQAIHNQGGYRGIKAPTTINHRYVNEDIPMSLVPLASLGNKFGIRVRAMESVIRLACIARGVDYWAIGRTVENLEIDTVQLKELFRICRGREPVEDLASRVIRGANYLGLPLV
jgi:opine dehydrogenase